MSSFFPLYGLAANKVLYICGSLITAESRGNIPLVNILKPLVA